MKEVQVVIEQFRSGGWGCKLCKLSKPRKFSKVSMVRMVIVKCFIRIIGGFIVCALWIYGLLSLVFVCFGVKAGFDLQRDKCIGPFFLYREEMERDDTTYILKADAGRMVVTATDTVTDADRKADVKAYAKSYVKPQNSPDATYVSFDTRLKADIASIKEALPPCVSPGLYVFKLNRDLGPFGSGSLLVKEVVATGRCLLRQRIVPTERSVTPGLRRLYGYELTISDTKTVYLLGNAVIFNRQEVHWYCEGSEFWDKERMYKERIEHLVPQETLRLKRALDPKETFAGDKTYKKYDPESVEEGSVEPRVIEFSHCYRTDSRHHGAFGGIFNTPFGSNTPFGFSSEISPNISSEITSEISFFTLPSVVLLDSNRLYKISLDKGELFLVGATAHAFDSRLLGAVPYEVATRYFVLWHIGKPLAKARMHNPGVYSLNLWKDYKDR